MKKKLHKRGSSFDTINHVYEVYLVEEESFFEVNTKNNWKRDKLFKFSRRTPQVCLIIFS